MKKKRSVKNINGIATVDINYQGNRIVIRPKCTYSANIGSNPDNVIDFLLQRYGFLVEITPKKKFELGEVKKAKGKKYV